MSVLAMRLSERHEQFGSVMASDPARIKAVAEANRQQPKPAEKAFTQPVKGNLDGNLSLGRYPEI